MGSFILDLHTNEVDWLVRKDDQFELELEIVPYAEAKKHLEAVKSVPGKNRVLGQPPSHYCYRCVHRTLELSERGEGKIDPLSRAARSGTKSGTKPGTISGSISGDIDAPIMVLPIEETYSTASLFCIQ